MNSKEEVKMDREKDRLVNLKTQSGFEVKASYGPEDIADIDYGNDLGSPGTFPYTRGRYPEMYRKMVWVKEVPVGFGTSEDTRDRLKHVIAHGFTAIRFAPDHASINGVDIDHPLVREDVGFSGPPRSALYHLERELDGIALLGGRLEIPYAPSPGDTCLYSMLVALGEKRGTDLTKLRGSAVNDGIHTHIMEWCNCHPLDFTFKLSVDTVEFSLDHTPAFHPLNPCGYDLRESGITTVQEVAFILAERIAFIDALVARGVPIDKVASKLVLGFSGEIDFFETVCKLRAARRMWARIATERYNAKDVKAICPPCNINTAGDSMVAEQPINNVARLGVEVLAAVFGGAQGIEVRGFDEAICIPSEKANLVSMAIHEIIAHETGAPLVADPLGGSYYVEWLTNKIEKEVLSYLKIIEDKGGILKTVESGWAQAEVKKSALERQKELDEKSRYVVGVNHYNLPHEEQVQLPRFKIEGVEKTQDEILKDFKEYRESRDLSAVRKTLDMLGDVAKNDKNVIRSIIDAFKAGATHGEVNGIIREGMGYSYDPFNFPTKPDFLN